MRCLIVDDEHMAIKVIENHLEQIDGLEIVGSYSNAMDAFKVLQSHSVDLLFLDIQMPKMSGLTLLKSLPSKPHVILTTAHREFALEGYELDVVDYLLKPIAFDRFLKAIAKVYRLNNQPSPQISPLVAPAPTNEDAFFYIKCDRQFVKIRLDEVLYIESLRNHIKIVSTTGTYLPLMGISQMEEKLPPQDFVRIHRSYVIALSKVERFTQTQVTIKEKSLPIGSSYREEVHKLLGKGLL
ncbi:MAG: LytTR family DNA-binding domain-containing protein [Bacteroidota bacterium]